MESSKKIRPMDYIRRPNADEIKALAAMEYMNLSDQEAKDLEELADELLNAFDRLDDLPVPSLKATHTQRDPGYRPSEEDNPYNSFIRKCSVKGAPSGRLKGKRVGLKDNISVAGIPLTNASRLCQGYVPDLDATVVTRLLDEGAEIVGKLNMDNMSFSGTGETSYYGATRNPHDPDCSAGGSSSGSGSAVASGEVDIALGVDEGGSARTPAAWCGAVSIKPTHGLVPSFGLVYIDHTFDYICPITRTVSDAALTLEVIAGEDPLDPQWVRGPIKVEKYTEALRKDVSKLRIGLIRESMQWPQSEPDVNDSVKKAMDKLASLGAKWEEFSLPIFEDAYKIWLGVSVSAVSAMMESDGEGFWHKGFANLAWNEAFGKFRRARADDIPAILKLTMIVGKYLRRDYYNRYYYRASNLRHLLRQKIDEALTKYDILATPTQPIKAPRLDNRLGIKELTRKGIPTLRNTGPFNITGHPAITIPCAKRSGLPIGLQLVAKHFEEALLFRVAYTFEQCFDWQKI